MLTGMTVTEADFKANATVLSGLRQYGWQYALIDAGWYMENPAGVNQETKRYVLDGDGRLTPAVDRFPSAAGEEGFKPLADWLHGKGLKFGIHVMPGVPKQAVVQNLPIAGSAFHAVDAADTSQTCSWDGEFYVAKDNVAGQAYYDSIMKLYADWGVDYIKLGCVSDHPFHPTRIRQITNGFSKKVENHAHAVALHYMYYNFCRIHQTLRVTPAMEAKIADHVWSVDKLITLLPKPVARPTTKDRELFLRALGETA